MNIDMGIYSGIFAVPTCVVDRYLKLADESALKVLLILLRYSDQDIDVGKISEKSGLSDVDVIDSLKFWIDQGLIDKGKSNAILHNRTYENNSVIIPIDNVKHDNLKMDNKPESQTNSNENSVISEKSVPVKSFAEPQKENNINTNKVKHTVSNVVVITKSLQYPSYQDAVQRMTECSDIACLVSETIRILNSHNSSAIVRGMAAVHDMTDISNHSIIMIVSYCKSVGMHNIDQIVEMCMEYHNKSDLYDSIDEFLATKTVAHRNENAVRSVFGIGRRAFTPTESEFINNWFFELGFTIDFIKIAYVKSIDTIHELSFQYINKILVSWKEKGITTLEAAEQDKKEISYDPKFNNNTDKPQKSVKPIIRKYSNTSYDIDELEQHILYNTPKL